MIKKLVDSNLKYLFTFFLGSTVPMVFAPFEIHLFILLSFGSLFLMYGNSPIQNAKLGFSFGLGLYGIGASWVYISIHDYGHLNEVLSILITLAMIVYLAIYPALHGALFSKFSSLSIINKALSFASMWTVTEWLCGWIFTGFPWLFIGYSQSNTILGSFLPIFGVLGTSFLTILVSCLLSSIFSSALLLPNVKIPISFIGILLVLGWLYYWASTKFPWLLIDYYSINSFLDSGWIFKDTINILLPSAKILLATIAIIYLINILIKIISSNNKLILPIGTVAAIFILAIFSSSITWTNKISPAINVGVIQANIEQNNKWDPEYLKYTLDTYKNLTKKLKYNDLIVWPEAAVPIIKGHINNYLNQIHLQALENNTGIILGIPIKEGENIYNSALGIGTATGKYHKQYLVPFGEYIPVKPIFQKIIDRLQIPMSNFHQGKKHQENIKLGTFPVATFICYEVAYDNAFTDQRKYSDLFITISNDAWFGKSIALDQHLQIAQARARQSGKYHIVSTNTGITSIISPTGKLLAKIPPFRIGVLEAKIHYMRGLTPWTYIGTAPIVCLLLLLLAVIFARNRKKIGE